MPKNFLLEIGLEEMPAHVVSPSEKQLVEKIGQFLTENRLHFDSITGFSTPRRLAVRVNGLAETQTDTKEEFKGPAKKIALDENGDWSKAALGFVRGKGLTPEDITFKEIKGVEYLFVTKEEKGKSAKEILTQVSQVIENLTFSVSMHWADYDFHYIRPIHWLVGLLEEEIIDFKVLDVVSGRISRGHRLIEGVPTFSHANDYEEELAKYNVIANAQERKSFIVSQIKTLEQASNWHIDLDEDLLEEVNNLVEFPTAFSGKFDEKYLDVPEEVLVTSMKEHQRFFDARNADGTLAPYFISVRNGTEAHLENVIKGNEKVLVARLEDGEFFWKEDQKLVLADLLEKLTKVTFHEKIGTLAKHMLRTKAIAEILADTLKVTETQKADILRAADIYKFDLVTNMVGEFPELQGIMGEKYATLFGENAQVAQAIREHYMPISAEGDLPESTVGAILAIADKLESVMSFFSKDLIPSGSNDPYALRRATQGVIRILNDKQWTFSITEILTAIVEKMNADSDFGCTYTNEGEILSFIKGRIRQMLRQEIERADVVDAIVASSQTEISKMFESAKVLDAHTKDENFREVIESLTRVVNIAQKAEVAVAVNVDLFESDEEKALHEKLVVLENATFINAEENYQALAGLENVISAYFENTLVMSDNEDIKNNRLSELKGLATMILAMFDVTQLLVKEQS